MPNYLRINFDALLEAHPNIKKAVDEKIIDWYEKEFPDDTMGERIAADLTFYDLIVKVFGQGANFYETLGVSDSVIRERVFNEIENRTQLPYDLFYFAWLYD